LYRHARALGKAMRNRGRIESLRVDSSLRQPALRMTAKRRGLELAANPSNASFSLPARFARIFLTSNQLDQREQFLKNPTAWNAAAA
jgi:hypothetical protein